MATPIIIGSYCSDFTIDQPPSGDDYYYYAAIDTNNNNNIYYLSTSRVTNGDGTSANDVDSAGADTVRIIPSTFTIRTSTGGTVVSSTPAAGTADDVFREFRFKLHWQSSIRPDFVSPSIIPGDRRRYLFWKEAGTADGTHTGETYTDTKTDRFVELTNANNLVSGVQLSGTATDSAAKVTTLQQDTGLSLTQSNIRNLRFFATRQSPTIQEKSNQLKYLILQDDFEKRETRATDARKSLRYLVWNGSRFELLDLYDPDVTTTTISRCVYRVSKQTNANLSGGNIEGTTTTAPTVNTDTIGNGGTVTVQAPTITWGVDSYIGNSSVSLTAPNDISDPAGFTSTSTTQFMFSKIGFGNADFTPPTGSTLESLLSQGFQNVVITFDDTNRLTYVDVAAGETATKTTSAALQLKFVFTNFIVDKQVEELFTDVNVTLLKVQSNPSSPPYPSSPIVTGTNNFLGFEQVTPGNPPSIENVSGITSATGLGARPTDLVVRDYYKFYNPARATQFKFYDLGKGTEYLWQVNWPNGYAQTYGYIVSDGAIVQIVPQSSIGENQRGWIMEYDSSTIPPGVKLRWAGTVTTAGVAYIGLGGALTLAGLSDGSPARVRSGLVNSTTAAIFNCIQCSSIDSTGACVPIPAGSRYLGNQSPPGGGRGRSPITLAMGATPVPGSLGNFKIRLNTIGTGALFQYTVSQIPGGTAVTGSPIASFSPGAVPLGVVVSTSPSPVPNSITDFVFTRQGAMTPGGRAMKNRAVFIKAANENLYLKAVTVGNTTRVELIASNAPSDDDGFAWAIQQVPISPGSPAAGSSRLYYLSSISTSGSPGLAQGTNRYLQSDGSTLGTTANAARIVFDNVNLAADFPSVINNSLT